MSNRNVYHVTYWSAKSAWRVIKVGGYVLKYFDTKKLAISYAVSVAKNNQPSQVVVHRKDGTIETEWTYGNDPFPPIG